MSKTITVRVDAETKDSANKIFKELGIDMSTAVNMFLKQTIINNGIPFALSANNPNKATIKALKEIKDGDYATFDSIDELMEDLND